MYNAVESHQAVSTGQGVPAPEGDERRTSARVDFSVEVNGEAGHQFFTGFTENISTGGLFIATYQTMPLGACLRVAFRIPRVDRNFECNAQVRWVRDTTEVGGPGPGMGVAFLDLSYSDSVLIDAILRQLETMFYES